MHCVLIYALTDLKKTYIEPSFHHPIKLSFAEEKSRMNNAVNQGKLMIEKGILRNDTIKVHEDVRSQRAYLDSFKPMEFGEFDIQIEEVSDMPNSLPKPHYPLISKRLKEQGDVLVRACILADGKRNTVTIHKSSGHHRLDQSALDAVKRWKELLTIGFQPLISRCYRIPVRFRLTSE